MSLRKSLLLPLDDLLAVVREFLNPNASRSGLDRCLRRHGVSNLRDLREKAPRSVHRRSNSCLPVAARLRRPNRRSVNSCPLSVRMWLIFIGQARSRSHRGRAAKPPFQQPRRPGADLDALCAPIQHPAPAISPEGQDADTGNEGMARTQTRVIQEKTILPGGMRQLRRIWAIYPTANSA